MRSWHANISAFIAPMVLFFALSGAIQVFDLHESHGDYRAPAIVTAIGNLHKKQIFAPVKPHARPGGPPMDGPPRGGSESGPPKTTLATFALRVVFFFEALGLAATTSFGVWIGLTHAKRKRTILILLVAGTVVPLALLVL